MFRHAVATLKHALDVAKHNLGTPESVAAAASGALTALPVAPRGLTQEELEAALPDPDRKAMEDTFKQLHPNWEPIPHRTAGDALVNRTYRQWKSKTANCENLRKVRSRANTTDAPVRHDTPFFR